MTEPLPPGLYEVLVTEVLAEQLAQIEDRLVVSAGEVRAAEVADRVALHLGRVIERAIDGAPEDQRVEVAIAVARDLVARLDELVSARARSLDLAPERPVEPGSVLRSITVRRPDGTPDVIAEPLIPLLDTTLLTNAPGEPRVGSQVLAEVASADRIDVEWRTSVAAASVRCSMRCAATASGPVSRSLSGYSRRPTRGRPSGGRWTRI